MQDSSEKSLLLSEPSSLEFEAEDEALTKYLDDDDRDDVDLNNATGFNIFIASPKQKD